MDEEEVIPLRVAPRVNAHPNKGDGELGGVWQQSSAPHDTRMPSVTSTSSSSSPSTSFPRPPLPLLHRPAMRCAAQILAALAAIHSATATVSMVRAFPARSPAADTRRSPWRGAQSAGT